MEWTEKDVGVTTRKASPYFYVTIPGRDKKYVSSGQTSRKRAIEWALREAMGKVSPDITLAEYARDFFVAPLCPIIKLRERAHGKRTLKHWDTMRQLLTDYILPRWGRTLYALKHGAVTGFRTDLGMDEAALLVGHASREMGNTYDHPDDAKMVARAKKAAGR